eukprot:9528125-Ditylum_brightwellii.AAC.1
MRCAEVTTVPKKQVGTKNAKMVKSIPMKEKKGSHHREEREKLSVILKAVEGRKSSWKRGNTTLPNTANTNTMSPNAQMTQGQKQVYEKGKKPPTHLRQRPLEEEKRRSPHGIVATNKKGSQKMLKGQETRTCMCNMSEKRCNVSEEEQEHEVVIEKGKQCSI